MKVRNIILVLALLAAVCLPLGVQADDATGSIVGTVTNGTPGGGSVAGMTITLGRYNGMNLEQEYTATTDQDGHYSFTGLPISDQEGFVARTSYLNVDYNSSMIQLSQTPNATADIKVFETTTDGSKVNLTSRGVVVAGADTSSRLLSMFEILAIDNGGDRTYMGNNGEVLRLALPDGTAQIEPQPGFDFGNARMDKGTLVTDGPIPPGQSNAMVAYSVPYQGTAATLNIPTAMPTGTLRVMVKDGTYTVTSPALNDNGTVNVGGDNYHVLSVDKPIVNDSITVRVTGLPKAGASKNSDRGPIYAGIAAVAGLIAAGALVFQVLRRRRAATPRLAVAGAVPEVKDERIGLAAQLNQLDADRAAGKIDDATYKASRDEVVQKIRSLSRQLRGLEEADD